MYCPRPDPTAVALYPETRTTLALRVEYVMPSVDVRDDNAPSLNVTSTAIGDVWNSTLTTWFTLATAETELPGTGESEEMFRFNEETTMGVSDTTVTELLDTEMVALPQAALGSRIVAVPGVNPCKTAVPDTNCATEELDTTN